MQSTSERIETALADYRVEISHIAALPPDEQAESLLNAGLSFVETLIESTGTIVEDFDYQGAHDGVFYVKAMLKVPFRINP